MKAEWFEIDYVDRETGERVVKEMEGGDLARKTAKALAQSSGKRVIVRKVPKRPWRVYRADLEEGTVVLLDSQLSLKESARVFLALNAKAKQRQAVLIFWPEWAGGILETFAQTA